MRQQSLRLFLTLFCAVLSFAAYAQNKIHRERGSSFIVSIGQEAPRFSFVTSDNDTLDSDLLRGQVLVIDFAASWCPFSPSQLADHQKQLWDKFSRNPNFSLFVICEDHPQDRAAFSEIISTEKIQAPVVFDDAEAFYQLFVTPNGSVTRTVIISPDWTIANLQDGHTRRGMRQIRKTVRHLLKRAN